MELARLNGMAREEAGATDASAGQPSTDQGGAGELLGRRVVAGLRFSSRTSLRAGVVPSRRSRCVLLIFAIAATAIPTAAHLATPIRALASSPYASTVLARNPDAYWRLGSGGQDQSTNGNSATAYGGVTFGGTGAIYGDSNASVALDGSSGYLEAADSTSLDSPSSAISIEAWVKPTAGAFNSQIPVVVKGYTSHNPPYYQYALFMDDTGGFPRAVYLNLATGANVRNVVGSNWTGWTYGAWNHIVATYDGSHARIYVNGVMRTNAAVTGTLDAYPTTTDIGAYGNLSKTSGNLFAGSLGEMAIYSSVLSSSQVQADYEAGFAPSSYSPASTQYSRAVLGDHPVAFWRLGEQSGPTASDVSGNSNTGIYSGQGVTFGTPGGPLGDPDNAISLDGNTGYAEAADSAALDQPTSALTLEAWVNPTPGAFSTQIPVVQKAYTSHDPPFYQYGIFLLDSGTRLVSFQVSVGGLREIIKTVDSNWTYSAWNHVLATFDGSHAYIYLNGVSVGTTVCVAQSTSDCSTATAGPNLQQTGVLNTYPAPLDMGGYGNGSIGTGNVFTGMLDEVAVYSTALAAPRVQAHYAASGRTPALVGGPVSTAQAAAGGLNNTITCSGAGVVHGNATHSPVDTESGNFWHAFVDVSITGRSCPLQMDRTYNSQSASTNSPVGYGWQYNYAMSLSVSGTSPNQVATLTQENGSQATFNQPASGSSWAPSAPRFIATLVHNADGTWTLTRQAHDTYTFNASGQLTAITDLNGYVTALSYSGGNLTTVTDPAGRTLSLGWTGSNISSVTDANITPSRTVSYAYDASGNLQDVIDVNGGDTHFTYDTSHRMLTMKDPKCQALGVSCAGVQNHYDASGRVDWQKDQLNRQTSFAYAGSPGDATGGTTTTTDPKGNVTVEGYQYGIRTLVTRGSGTAQAATTDLQYDPNTLAPTGALDPNGQLTTQTVDSSGNVLTSTDPLGRTTRATYNSLNEPLNVQDGKGVTTTMTYDSNGNLLTKSMPLVGSSPAQSQVTTNYYDDSTHPGDVTRTVDPAGKTWSFGYDTYGDRTSVTDPLGHKATSTFNGVGWTLTGVSAKGNVTGCGCAATYTTTYSYVDPDTHATDQFGDVATVIDPLGHVAVTKYDADRNVTSSKDADGNTTGYTYDLANQRTTVTRTDTTTLATDYNADGSVLDQKDGKTDAIQTYAYDGLGRVTSVTDALGNVTAFTYDGAGNRLTKQDPGGSCSGSPKTGCTTFGYDADNELTSVTYSDGVTPNVTGITYDADGQRTATTDGSGSWSWSWDSLHRLTSVTEGPSGSVGYQYDLRNLVTQITYSGSQSVSRGYDDAGRWTSVSDWNGNTTSFGYDANSNLTTETLPTGTGVVDTFGFDAADRLMSISDTTGTTTVFTATYSRDAANQVTADSSVPPTAGSYRYTTLNQLCYAASGNSSACSSPPPASTAYGFDAADNLTTNGGTTQAFNAADELCWSVTGTSTNGCASPPTGATQYTYDTRGNRTAVTPTIGLATTLTYDQADRLTGWSRATTTASYGYNADGLRMSKTVGTTTQTLWDVAAGLPLVLKDGSTAYVTGPGGLPLEQVNGSTVLWLHHDQLRSTRLITDGAGVVQATYTYDAYGNLVASTGTVSNPFRFSGQYQDAESGLYYLRARYYDPVTAQLLSTDLAVALTRSPYGYVAGNPLNGLDPSGLDTALPQPSYQGPSYTPSDYSGMDNSEAYCDKNGNTTWLAVNLPTGGSFPYDPGTKGGKPRKLPGSQGFRDKYGDSWKWDPVKKEFDVTHRDGSHTNIGEDGEITHGPNNTGRSPQVSNIVAAGAAGAAAAGGGVILWWIGKAASGICGPAAPACALIF